MRAAIKRILAGPPALEVAVRQLAAAQVRLLEYEEAAEQSRAAVSATETKIVRLRERIAALAGEEMPE